MAEHFIPNHEQKFEALKMRYQDHVELLRMMTKLDLEMFGGYITLQLGFGSWIATPFHSILASLALLLVDGSMAFIASILFRNNKLRRDEAIETLRNVMSALKFNEDDEYIKGKPINPRKINNLRHLKN